MHYTAMSKVGTKIVHYTKIFKIGTKVVYFTTFIFEFYKYIFLFRDRVLTILFILQFLHKFYLNLRSEKKMYYTLNI